MQLPDRVTYPHRPYYNVIIMTVREIRMKYHYAKKDWWRRNRILFPSPAEVRFVQIMGGRTVTINALRHPATGYPLVIFVSMGRLLRREFVQREVRVGAMYIDFAFETRYTKKGIEIDGADFHRDIVREQQRDDYLGGYGWRILHIQASDLYRSPDSVQRRVMSFLS